MRAFELVPTNFVVSVWIQSCSLDGDGGFEDRSVHAETSLAASALSQASMRPSVCLHMQSPKPRFVQLMSNEYGRQFERLAVHDFPI